MLFGPPADSSWIELLPDGHQGTWRTLETMRYLVRKDAAGNWVHGFLQQHLTGAQSAHPVESLFLFARDRIRYVEDPPGLEQVSDFQRTTEAGQGDCDDKAVWLAAALLSLNIPVRFVVQSYGETWDHVYLEFYDWAQLHWVALDPTADGHGGTPVAGIGWRQPLPIGGYEMRFDV